MPRITLRFPIAGVAALVHHARHAAEHEQIDPEDTGPALILVGTEGVALRSNGQPGPHHLVYAEGCDPAKVPLEEWYPTRRAIFGREGGFMRVELGIAEDAIANQDEFLILDVPTESS